MTGPSWHPPQSHLLRRYDWRPRDSNLLFAVMNSPTPFDTCAKAEASQLVLLVFCSFDQCFFQFFSNLPKVLLFFFTFFTMSSRCRDQPDPARTERPRGPASTQAGRRSELHTGPLTAPMKRLGGGRRCQWVESARTDFLNFLG